MNKRPHTSFWKRKVYVKKRFQTDFSLRFLILIVIEAILAVGLFVYLSRGTVITGFSGNELVIEKTGEYFLPTILLANLVIIGLTAAGGFIVLIYTSHKIAGPLFRFERSLGEVGNGDLTLRFSLRSKDELGELAERMSELTTRLDSALSNIKRDTASVRDSFENLRSAIESGDFSRASTLMGEVQARIEDLERSENYFKTSDSRGKR